MKWRFLDEATSGFDMSMFPRIIFNVAQSSVRRGLAEDGTRFQIPFQVAKKFGRLIWMSNSVRSRARVGRSEWLYGIVGGFDVAKTTMLMAELHDTSRMNFTPRRTDGEFRLAPQDHRALHLIASLGHELRVAG